MCLIKKHKKYQYLYLQEKIDYKKILNDYHDLDTEHWDNLGTGLSEESRESADNFSDKCHKRVGHLQDWLDRINKKYNYA